MAMALFTTTRLWVPLQRLASWLWQSQLPHRATSKAIDANASRTCVAAYRPVTPLPQRRSDCHRPLRVLRVVEGNQSPAQAGRMVISGRMADVCAELDRLAAAEALILH